MIVSDNLQMCLYYYLHSNSKGSFYISMYTERSYKQNNKLNYHSTETISILIIMLNMYGYFWVFELELQCHFFQT